MRDAILFLVGSPLCTVIHCHFPDMKPRLRRHLQSFFQIDPRKRMTFSLLICDSNKPVCCKDQLAYHSCRLVIPVLFPFSYQCATGSGCDRCRQGGPGLLFKTISGPRRINIHPRCRKLIIHVCPRRIIPVGKPRQISVTVIRHDTKHLRHACRKYIDRVRKTGLLGGCTFISCRRYDHCHPGSFPNCLF